MQIPVPSRAHIGGLGVHSIVPSPDTQLQPPLSVDRKINLPKPPGIVILCAHLLIRDFIPDAASIARDLDADGPMATAGISPAAHFDLAVVDDLGHVDGSHDGRGDGHVLDAEAVAVHGVLLADLGCVVKVFFRLDGGETGASDGFDFVEPFATSSSNVCLCFDQHQVENIERTSYSHPNTTVRSGNP